MTIALVSIIGVLSVSFTVFAFLSRADSRELLAARDRIEKLDERCDNAERDLMLETAAHRSTQDLLTKERDLRASVESERNQAFEQGVTHVVEKLKASNIADVQRFTANLLATPLPGWVPKALPEGRATAPGPDSLINPFLPATGDTGSDR